MEPARDRYRLLPRDTDSRRIGRRRAAGVDTSRADQRRAPRRTISPAVSRSISAPARPLPQPRRSGISNSAEAPRFRIGIVIDIETGRKTEPRIQRKGTDKCSSREASALQRLGQSLSVGPQTIAVVVADAVLERIQTCQDARVRRERDDGMGVSEIKTNAPRRRVRRAPALRRRRRSTRVRRRAACRS